MSDTPRTDAIFSTCNGDGKYFGTVVPVDFARQLELELAEKTRAHENADKNWQDCAAYQKELVDKLELANSQIEMLRRGLEQISSTCHLSSLRSRAVEQTISIADLALSQLTAPRMIRAEVVEDYLLADDEWCMGPDGKSGRLYKTYIEARDLLRAELAATKRKDQPSEIELSGCQCDFVTHTEQDGPEKCPTWYKPTERKEGV